MASSVIFKRFGSVVIESIETFLDTSASSTFFLEATVTWGKIDGGVVAQSCSRRTARHHPADVCWGDKLCVPAIVLCSPTSSESSTMLDLSLFEVNGDASLIATMLIDLHPLFEPSVAAPAVVVELPETEFCIKCRVKIEDLSLAVAPLLPIVAESLRLTPSSLTEVEAATKENVQVEFLFRSQERDQEQTEKELVPRTIPRYGCLPLDELYLHCCEIFNMLRKLFGKKPFRPSKAVIEQLRPSGEGWEKLVAIDLGMNIVGDVGIPPILAVARCCRRLQQLTLDRNTLSLPSARLLFAALRDHSALNYLSVAGNNFFESAGEELLRIVRVNPHVTTCCLEGNAISRDDENPFNPVAAKHNYLVSAESIPKEVWAEVGTIWALLTAQPATFVIADENEKRNAAVEEATGFSRIDAVVPMGVTAPLFSEVFRTLQWKMEQQFEDPDVRRVFGDIHTTVKEAATDVAKGDVYPISYAKMVFVPIRIMMLFPHRWADAIGVLQGLGRMHATLGIKATHYATANELFVAALTAHVGPDILTPKVRAAWTQVLTLIARTTLSGSHKLITLPNFVAEM